jgi:hypothetical protein
MNELTFLDLVILKKVDAESTVEKFGSLINTSFFETANLLGTIKIKGYINIESSVGGVSQVVLTDAGSSLLVFANQKAKDPIEPLDNAILHALAGGARELDALQHALNIRSGDLAYHINKLVAQGFMDFEVRSAKVYFVLTEMGFNATGGVRVQQSLAPEQQKELKAEAAGAQEKPEGEAAPTSASFSVPPWVKPSDVKPEGGKGALKEDVAHIMGEHLRVPKPEKQHEQQKKPHKRELTPEEQKRHEKTRRLFSKIQYYIVEYAPYLVLIAMVLAIFAGAIFLSFSKFS